jgi:hypothetical protein
LLCSKNTHVSEAEKKEDAMRTGRWKTEKERGRKEGRKKIKKERLRGQKGLLRYII